MEKNTRHTLFLEHEQGRVATSVGEVLAFNEREIRLKLVSNAKLVVIGDKLKINGFDKGSGELRLSGVVCAVKYSSNYSKVKKLFG